MFDSKQFKYKSSSKTVVILHVAAKERLINHPAQPRRGITQEEDASLLKLGKGSMKLKFGIVD